MAELLAFPQQLLNMLTAWLAEHSQACLWFRNAARFLFPILAFFILFRTIRSLLTVSHLPEVWGYLALPNGAREPLIHWENILGRGDSSDIVLNYPTISRQHAALIRTENDAWSIHDLDSKSGVCVNGQPVRTQAAVAYGDVLSFGGVETVLLPMPLEERERWHSARRTARPVSPWPSLLLLTLFQILTVFQLLVALGTEAGIAVPLSFFGLSAVMWLYAGILRACRRVGFEMETIAFFLSTLSLAVTASSAPEALFKQLAAVLLGIVLFLILGIFLRDLERAKRIRWLMAGGAILLLSITLILRVPTQYGAANWIRLGPLSLQPSELAKLCYIFAGSATLDRLFRKRNLGLFILLTAVCLGCLALMSDFGTAAIFFVVFLVIAYLRSGDWTTLALITGAAGAGALVILSIKPYILQRFATWGHAWEYASSGGFQQTRTMSAAASGGLTGVGAGNGWLHHIGAADTDLVFGMLCEEWGFLIAALAVLCIATLAAFAVRACKAGRSSFYTIAACAATSLLVFQTCLNVFGAVDLLPLTGVTFPFVSNGGSAMVASWGLLAFLKATDTRENASFAIALFRKSAYRSAGVPSPAMTPQKGGDVS